MFLCEYILYLACLTKALGDSFVSSVKFVLGPGLIMSGYLMPRNELINPLSDLQGKHLFRYN